MDLWKALRSKLGRKGVVVAGAGSKRAAAMQRIQWVLGISMTIAIAAIWWNGWLDKFERDSLDVRAKNFPSTNAHPSDRVVVIAIDDAAIDNIGRWPWDREKLAAIIDELTNAGVAVVALDLLLDNPQEGRPKEGATPGVLEYVNDDRILGDAMKRHGRVISAVSFIFTKDDIEEDGVVVRAPLSRLYQAMREKPALAGQPFDAEIGGAKVSSLLRAQLPGFTDLQVTQGKEIEKLRLRWDAANTLVAHQADSSLALPAADSTPWAVSIEPGVPIAPIAAASRRIANVSFDSYDPDGLTRRIPLVVQHNGRLWPTLGLAAALEFYNARAAQSSTKPVRVDVNAESVQVDTPDGETRTLDAFTQRVQSTNVAGLHMVSWPRALRGGGIPAGVNGWQRQFYDDRPQPGHPNGEPAEVPIGRVYEPARLQLAVTANIVALRKAMNLVYVPERVIGGKRLEAWNKVEPALVSNPVGSVAWREALDAMRPLFQNADVEAKALADFKLQRRRIEDLPPAEQMSVGNLLEARAASLAAFKAIDEGLASASAVRKELRERLAGTICFVGWTATGSLADFVATSIHPRTPGVHLHAAVCNSVLTGFQRTQGSFTGQMLVIVSLGLVGTWIGVRSTVVGGPLLVLGALALWTGFACVVLWSMYDSVWSIAGPIAAATSSWLVVVLHRLLVEQRSRRKTEERFKSYVSPAVVDILVENPSLSSMAPQQKELSVMFTDIAAFTTTAERLGSQGTAELLAVYLGTMTDVVQRHGATLDKYIGDAIMAFWGAPVDDAQHARHSCAAAVEMMQTLDRLNAEKAFGEAAGTLKARIGLASGELMVGDFGNPPRNSSYTVIGDTVNLASRLEGATRRSAPARSSLSAPANSPATTSCGAGSA
ncbi:MAG: adenylate/guanylate cyclase domain-containing protein [Phycisphaerales bacterium]